MPICCFLPVKADVWAIRSGRSLFPIHNPIFQRYWRPLRAMGCAFENANDYWIAVDVPSKTDIHRAYALLEKGERDGVWTFEEAHCGHAIKRPS